MDRDVRFSALLSVFLLAAAAQAAPLPVDAGSRAPNFTRQDFDGHQVTLEDYRGKVVLLDFWASWCAPCLEDMPHLIKLQKQHGDRLQIIGISMDDRVDAAKSVTRRFTFNYPLLMGDAKLGILYGGILGLPQLFLISRDGEVLKVWRDSISPGELDQAVATAIR